MQCSEINELIMKYLDNEITPFELELIHKHNRECKACAEAFEVLKNAISTVEAMPDIDVPDDFEAKVMSKIELQSKLPDIMQNAQLKLLLVFAGIGSLVFAGNILSYVLLPFFTEKSILDASYNLLSTLFVWVAELISRIGLSLSLTISRLPDLQLIFIRNYVVFVSAMSCILMVLEILQTNRSKKSLG